MIIFLSITMRIKCVFFRNVGFMDEGWWALNKQVRLEENLELKKKSVVILLYKQGRLQKIVIIFA